MSKSDQRRKFSGPKLAQQLSPNANMKRTGPGSGGGYNNEGPMKRPRGDKFETRVLVPSKVAGSVIGKGGSNIQKLRTDNNANIRIPDCPGPERIMTILTDDSDTAVKVLEQSIPYMTDANTSPDTPTEVRFLIHQSIVGGIIGRAGFKIKEIRDNSGATIKVYQNCAPQSTDRCVSLGGTADKIVKAAAEVLNVVAMTEIKGPDQQYDPINFDSYYANEYGGYGADGESGGGMMGGGGGRGRGGPRGGMGGMGGGFGGVRGGGQMGAFNGGRGGGFNNGFGGRGGGGMGRGGGGGFGNRGGRGGGFGGGGGPFAGDAFGAAAPAFGGGGGGEMGGPMMGGFGGGASGGMEDSNEPHEETAVTIPKDMAGAIIGPGGSRIRKIRADSKATITIAEPDQGSNERIITIAGSKRQIQTAQYLLQQSVRENSMPGGGGGQQGGYGGY